MVDLGNPLDVEEKIAYALLRADVTGQSRYSSLTAPDVNFDERIRNSESLLSIIYPEVPKEEAQRLLDTPIRTSNQRLYFVREIVCPEKRQIESKLVTITTDDVSTITLVSNDRNNIFPSGNYHSSVRYYGAWLMQGGRFSTKTERETEATKVLDRHRQEKLAYSLKGNGELLTVDDIVCIDTEMVEFILHPTLEKYKQFLSKGKELSRRFAGIPPPTHPPTLALLLGGGKKHQA